MKRGFLVSALSVLSTLAIGGGALVICDKLPSTKDKFTIKFGDNLLFGHESASALGKDELSEVAEQNGFAVVNYMLADQTITVIQKANTVFDIDIIPSKEGYAFLGWSTTPDGSNMVTTVEASCNLYPVFINGEGYIKVNLPYGGSNSSLITSASIGSDYNNYNLKFNIAGYSSSRDSIELVSAVEADEEYYAVFYVPATNEFLTLDEAETYIAEKNLGEKAHYNVTFVAPGVRYEGEFKNIKYGGTLMIPQSMDVEGVNYRLCGFATDPDSTTLYSSDYFSFNFEIEENGVYYAVYQGMSAGYSGYVTSAQLEAKTAIKVNVLGKAYQYDANYRAISTYTSFDTTLGATITQSQVTFEFKGWAVDPDSTEYYDMEYIQENDIAEVYAVYERSDISELITVNEFSELMKYYASNISVYDSTSYSGSKSYYTVYLLEGYQKDVIIDNTTYEFAGWSASSTSTELVEVDLSTNNYMSPLYAVYKNGDNYYTISNIKTISENAGKVSVVTFIDDTVAEYDRLTDYEMPIDILGITFEFEGWALDPDGTDVVDSAYVEANKIKFVYAVYKNIETEELITVQGLKDFEASRYISMVHVFDGDMENVNPVDFEHGVDVNGTYYEFYGWASEPTTEMIENDLYEYDELYAIYTNPDTGDLFSVIDLQAQ